MLSASQMAVACDCTRKWGFKYLQGIHIPAGFGAQLGERVHNLLAAYLLRGEVPYANTAEADIVLHILAEGWLSHVRDETRTKFLAVERDFKLDVFGTAWTGRKDLEYYDVEACIWVVHDHKTLSKMQYALSEEELKEDIQALIYAYETMATMGVSSVRLDWLYISTTRIMQKKVSVVVDMAWVGSRLAPVGGFAKHLENLRILWPFPLASLPTRVSACRKYGGCPFAHLCERTTEEAVPDLSGVTLC